MALNLKVDLDGIVDGDEADSIREDIIRRAADIVVKQLKQDVWKEAREQCLKMLHDQIQNELGEVFTLSLRRTDSYGRPRDDQQVTLVEVIVDEAKKWLEELVGRDGNRSSYNREDAVPRFIHFARKEAEKAMSDGLGKAVEGARDELKKQIGNKMGDVFRKALQEAAKI